MTRFTSSSTSTASTGRQTIFSPEFVWIQDSFCDPMKKPVNLTLHKKVLERAEALMELRSYTSLSVLIEELIRNEHEKRFGPAAPAPVPLATALYDKPATDPTVEK